MVLLIHLWIGSTMVLALIAHYFFRQRKLFPEKDFQRWQKSYHMFMITCLMSIIYVIIAIQHLHKLS